nr:hypothetical protein Itr_chr03CG03700 [Ipomoea trifida]
MAAPNQQQNLPASSIDSSLSKVPVKGKPEEQTRSAVGTSFQMRLELSTLPNTMVDVLQSTETNLVAARSFKLTTELLEKGSVGFLALLS